MRACLVLLSSILSCLCKRPKLNNGPKTEPPTFQAYGPTVSVDNSLEAPPNKPVKLIFGNIFTNADPVRAFCAIKFFSAARTSGLLKSKLLGKLTAIVNLYRYLIILSRVQYYY